MHYHRLGKIPHKRHIQFRDASGRLYQEEVFGREGFSGVTSTLYHIYPPPRFRHQEDLGSIRPAIWIADKILPLSFRTFELPAAADFFEARKVLFLNADVQIGVIALTGYDEPVFFKNADGDEILFVHRGEGVLRTVFGKIAFRSGDYLVIPKGTIYQLELNGGEGRLLLIESATPIHFPKRYRNEFGQLLEHSPFCERDIRVPEELQTHDEQGEFVVYIKKFDKLFRFTYDHHPFDVVGWDGYNYPYALSIHDFEPITGRIHQPPPVHQTFEARNFVVCSFVPRLYDYHPLAIPAPYHHSNIDSDEILYYVDGNFMSRNDVEPGYITLHPGGIPHGPHPGAIERSIGKKSTDELAVMIDPFRPIAISEHARTIANEEYYKSWWDK